MDESTGTDSRPCTFRGLVAYFGWLGTTGFGGPIALAAAMQRDLVETRRWITPDEYEEGLALAQLSPGPLAAQLAIYLGWVRYGVAGATAAGLAFVFPSFLMVIALAIAYLDYGGLPWIQGVFYGIGAATTAIILRSAFKLATRSLKEDRLLWSVALASAVVTAVTEAESLLLIVLSGLVVLAARARLRNSGHLAAALPWPLILVSGAKGPASASTLLEVLVYFTKAGAFVFGSGLAIVPFLYGGVVHERGWLDDRQFLDAVAVAMITPGPVVITVAFIGYLVAGLAGAVLAAVGTFVPCWLCTVIPAPWFKAKAADPMLRGFVEGVTAAATGAIGGAAWVLGSRSVFDLSTALIAAGSLAVLVSGFAVPEPLLMLAAGAIGLALRAS